MSLYAAQMGGKSKAVCLRLGRYAYEQCCLVPAKDMFRLDMRLLSGSPPPVLYSVLYASGFQVGLPFAIMRCVPRRRWFLKAENSQARMASTKV